MTLEEMKFKYCGANVRKKHKDEEHKLQVSMKIGSGYNIRLCAIIFSQFPMVEEGMLQPEED